MTEIPLPPASGSTGTPAYDPDTRAIYLAAPGIGLAIVDTTKKSVEVTVPEPVSPGGITFDQQYIYMAAPGQSHVQVIHKGDWSAESGADAAAPLSGGIWTDPPRNRVYALTQQGDVLALSAGPEPQLTGTYSLGASGPGTFVASTDTLYVAATGQITAFDAGSGQSHSAPLQDSSSVTGLTYDERTGLLWATFDDHRLTILDGKSLQAARNNGIIGAGSPPATSSLEAPSSSAISFDGILRFVYTFGASGFGAYDTNFDLRTAQVDTGDPSTSTGAVDPIGHYVYTFEPSHHVLGVYSWGAHGNAYTGPGGGGGGGASTPGGAGGSGSGAGTSGFSASPSGAGATAGGQAGSAGGAAASPAAIGASSPGPTSAGSGPSGTGSSSTSTVGSSSGSSTTSGSTSGGSAGFGGGSSSSSTSSGSGSTSAASPPVSGGAGGGSAGSPRPSTSPSSSPSTSTLPSPLPSLTSPKA